MRFMPVVSLLALAASANAAISASQLTSNIDMLTQLSSDTNGIAKDITVTNVFSKVPRMTDNFKQMIQTVINATNTMESKYYLETHLLCLDLTDVENCMQKAGGFATGPSEILRKTLHFETLDKTEREYICQSFLTFSDALLQLLVTTSAKHSILSLSPFQKPIAAALNLLEKGTDTLAFGIIDFTTDCGKEASQKSRIVHDTLTAVNEYS